ncbi:hypothetical protein [Kocuria sp.]|uniref:hypothetical protein n=1 Tax=Kocuria sp. TaxID=1871328 RepID=UPI0026DEA9F1|nr:hypothetical protein [Kocuria sp.]MDO5618184.1 hypothetical protein [Kocuria sp.]
MRPPKPYSCSRSVEIPLSLQETGHFMEDARSFLGFWASPGGRTSSSTERIAPGTVLEYPLALGPFTPSWIAVVSQFRREEKIVLRSTRGPVDARTTVAWEPVPGEPTRTRITLSVAGRPARRWSRFPGLLNTVTERYLAATARRLVKHVERHR